MGSVHAVPPQDVVPTFDPKLGFEQGRKERGEFISLPHTWGSHSSYAPLKRRFAHEPHGWMFTNYVIYMYSI